MAENIILLFIAGNNLVSKTTLQGAKKVCLQCVIWASLSFSPSVIFTSYKKNYFDQLD